MAEAPYPTAQAVLNCKGFKAALLKEARWSIRISLNLAYLHLCSTGSRLLATFHLARKMSISKVLAAGLALIVGSPLTVYASPTKATDPHLSFPPTKAIGPQYSFPVQNSAGYARYFGWQDSAHKKFNPGIDLLAPGGSWVAAWSSGTVKEISYSPECGWRIIITYKSWSTEYCNIGGGVTVPVGRQVQAGEVVAKLEGTPYNTLTTLHWRIRYKGKLIDPYKIIRMIQIDWKV